MTSCVTHAVECAVEETDIVKKGDVVVLTGGSPVGISGTTNVLKVQLVGDILASGQSLTHQSISGKVCVATSNNEALKNFEDGDILVIHRDLKRYYFTAEKGFGNHNRDGGNNISCGDSRYDP